MREWRDKVIMKVDEIEIGKMEESYKREVIIERDDKEERDRKK